MKKVLCGLVAIGCLAGPAAAVDGVWANPLGGLWSEMGNWMGGDVAADSGLATFGSPGGSATVMNDVAGLSLSGFTFNTLAGDEWLFPGLEITLAGTPEMDVAAGRAEFNASVRANGPLVKTGAGTLFFEGGLVSTTGVTLQGGVFEVRSGRELGSGTFNWEGGVVKVAEGEPGLQESSSGGSGSINLGTYGTNICVTYDLRMADIAACDPPSAYPLMTQYIYRGRWYVPADGVYSFLKDFDDGGYLSIDNAVIIHNNGWNDFIVVRDVPLRQGWHDIDVRVSQGTGGVGPQKGAPYGIMYDAANGDFSSPQAMAAAQAFADMGDGLALRTEMLTCISALAVLKDDVTLDASDTPPDYTPALLRGIQTATNALVSVPVLTVTGGDGNLIIGNWNTYGTIPLHAVFNADANVAGSVLFGGKVALYRLPTSCPWEILPKTDLLIGMPGILGNGPLTLTNHSVRINSEDAIGGPYAITVEGDGNHAIFDPTENVNGAWGPALTLTLAHDVILAGQNSAARFTGNGTCYYDGVISGIGSLLKDSGSTAHLRGVSTFEGDVQISGGRLNVCAPFIGGAHTNPVAFTGNGGTLSFDTSEPEAYVHTLSGTQGTLDIRADQTVTLNDLSAGTLTVTGAGTLCISNITPTVRLRFQNSIRLEIPEHITIPHVTLTQDNVMLELTGGGTLGGLFGAGSVIKKGDTPLTLTGAAGFEGHIIVEQGSLALGPPDIASLPSPAFWLDATQGASLDHTRNENSPADPEKDIIRRWTDWRGGGYTRYAEVDNPDGSQNYDRPFLLTGECNGLPVLSCGFYNQPPEVHEYRRLQFGELDCTRVIMLFGSQNGGGHILGYRNNKNTDFMRGGVENDRVAPLASNPIWQNENFPVRLDGAAVDGFTAGLNGGYQIVSVNFPAKHKVDTIGMLNFWENAGGQRYGEVLFFTDAITDSEARAVEAYLGNKWGIAAGRVSQITVQSGATLLVDGALQIDSLHGDGTLVKTGGGALRIGGGFSGAIDVREGTLERAPLPTPPSAEELPLSNMLFWLDACETNRMTFGPEEGQIFQWIDRRPGINNFGWSYWSEQYRERPWLVRTPAPRGNGLLTWVDFNAGDFEPFYANKYMKIRMGVDPDEFVQDGPGQANINNIRTGFVVLDSFRGGGLPLNDHFMRATPWDVASTPVWGGNANANVLNGNTRLDGVQINGRQTGYNGAVQVLSFATTGNSQFNFLAKSELALERIGEIILFDAVLSDATRRAYEAYLMNKWEGASGPGYHQPGDRIAGAVTIASGVTLDLSTFGAGEIGAVSGPGTLRVADFASLPAISGLDALEVLGGDITLDISTQGATPGISVTGALTLPPTGTLTLNFTERVPAGSIPLFAYGSLTGSGFDGWTLALTGEVPKGALVRLRQDAATTYAEIIMGGTILLVR